MHQHICLGMTILKQASKSIGSFLKQHQITKWYFNIFLRKIIQQYFVAAVMLTCVIANELDHLLPAAPNLAARRIIVAELFLRADLVFQRTPLKTVGNRGQRAAFQTFILQSQTLAVLCGLIDSCDLRHTMFFQPLIHDIQISVGMRMLAARICKQDQINGNVVLVQSNKKGGAVCTASIGNNIDMLTSNQL